MGAKPGKLSPQRMAFVREYQIDGNATQAALRAGYAERSARMQGCRLLTHPDIKRMLSAQQEKLAERCAVTIETITAMLLEDRQLARKAEQSGAAVSATLGLAKLHGLVVEKREVNGTIGTYEAVPIPVAERDPIPAVDATGRAANGRHPSASRH